MRDHQSEYPGLLDNLHDVARTLLIIWHPDRARVTVLDRLQGNADPRRRSRDAMTLGVRATGEGAIPHVYDLGRDVALRPTSVEVFRGATFYKVPVGESFDLLQVGTEIPARLCSEDRGFGHFMTVMRFPYVRSIKIGFYASANLAVLKPFRVLDDLSGTVVGAQRHDDKELKQLVETVNLIPNESVREAVDRKGISSSVIYDFTDQSRFKDVIGIRFSCQ